MHERTGVALKMLAFVLDCSRASWNSWPLCVNAPDVVSTVAPDGTPDSHAGNHDFITFRRGTERATCKQVVRIWCNTCLVCHACFCAGPRHCGEVVVNVADDVCDEGDTIVQTNWSHHVSQIRGVV